MSDNHEEILVNFQSITGIDDVAEAIFYLEEANWDLLTAVNRVLPQEELPYDPGSLNNLNITGNSVSDDAIASPPSPSALLHRNIFGAEPSMTATSEAAAVATATVNAVEANAVSVADAKRSWEYHSAVATTSSSVASTSTHENKRQNTFDDILFNGGEPSSSSSLPSSNKPKSIKFNIHHNYNTYELELSDRATVGELKTKIHELTGIPMCRQALRGWMNSNQTYTNTTKLSTMSLARENELIVSDMVQVGGFADDEQIESLNATFTLNIRNEKNGSTVQLKFPGTQTVEEVKRDVYTVTNIAVRHQEWIRWPPGVTDSTPLALTGIPREHDFSVRSTELPASNASNASQNEAIDIDSDSSVDEFEDASDFNGDDEIFTSSLAAKRIKHLIPDGTDNERMGCVQFVDNYKERYGEPHPNFFVGTLEEALNEACHKPAKDRKLLAIYLHHDGSVLTNVFCDRLMKCDTIMQTFEHNFILYGWDLTNESNKHLFWSSLSACAGSTALITARNTPVVRLPAILIIGKSRSVCEVLSVIYGNVGVDELLNKLMDTMKLYSDQRDIEIREEDERAEREMVKMEQDLAYHESLESDRRKEEAKQQKERAIATERKRLESERQEIEAIREMNRLEAESRVPIEPAADAEGITKIRIRKPTGEFLERRFLAYSPLIDLFTFVASKGFPIDEFKVISSWPRRDLTTLNAQDTMQNLNLCPQETVILEER